MFEIMVLWKRVNLLAKRNLDLSTIHEKFVLFCNVANYVVVLCFGYSLLATASYFNM